MEMMISGRPRVQVSPRNATDFETQFTTHYEGVYRLLYRIVGSREEAEDLAQETFLRLHRTQLDERDAGGVRAWLYRVGTNLAYNHVRGRSRRDRRDARAASRGSAVADPPAEPAVAAARAAEAAEVREALALMPRRQAELLQLRYAGLSYREVAEVLGVAPTSVGTMLARAEAAFETEYQAGRLARETEVRT